MTENIGQFDTVRVPAGIPESDVQEGAMATVLDVYTDPHLAYEIEVVDVEGRTLYEGVVDPSWVELVESYDQGDR
ncbi:DUF4926 domain-containing protein [Knoellia koreensis]|uniref:DUF4926 domain-containing protein n=1 Tax=Knoellia koreensis TaxID=2730921 RepID=A0A849HCH4_9MICO|nr:DUF4926 domain-containing protein [Knoellia sp. DB2414S]NNM44394.1 DUF4926 domain-containing protein [Knoellia sp. DB2414S]